jgi:heme/copper-type cytochrome/quinol oxidase subunit 2
MNPIKAAAILTLVVTIVAAVYLVYQATTVRAAYEKDERNYEECMAGTQHALENWNSIQSQARVLIFGFLSFRVVRDQLEVGKWQANTE